MLASDDERLWGAVQRRDQSADGSFVYAVRSTGVYCRPSCPSRPARRENVTFYADANAAEKAGFRPCKRCHPNENPDDRTAEAIRQACQWIETAEDQPDLGTLARSAGYSPWHFQKLFKAYVGLSPKQYAIACRKVRLRQALPDAGSVTDAIYAAGFGASSRAYEDKGALGMTPSSYRNGAEGETIRYASAESSLGPVLVAATERGVCMIEFGEPEQLVQVLAQRFPKACIVPVNRDLAALVERVVQLIDEPSAGCDLPLDIRGTAFQERVWKALTLIPAGETLSYAELAELIGRPSATRAVARACASNSIAVAVPCHRVVCSSGKLSGYKWGVERKEALLSRESTKSARHRR